MKISFELDVSYSQISVFLSDVVNPFNIWSDGHVAQGFAWRPGSVSFKTMAEFGKHTVDVVLLEEDKYIVDNKAIRVIKVPFNISSDSEIEIASVSESRLVKLPIGQYSLFCEFIEDVFFLNRHVRFVFSKSHFPEFCLIKADEGLTPPCELIKMATAANL